MYFRRKTSAGRAYLQIVESRREGDQVRQQVIATLGRFEDLQASGQLERLLRSGARFAAKAMMLSAVADDAAIKIAVRRVGPALVFERLWEETGCRAVIDDLAGARGHKFALERAVFLTVLHRLFVSGSDRAADRWREDYMFAATYPRGNAPATPGSRLRAICLPSLGVRPEVEIPKRLTVLVADDERPPARRPTRAAGSGD